jgi:predicted restriction endonuclease
LTGITEPALLRASHIVPWADSTDEQRLDVYNGVLLSALWDAAFDGGLISFADDGTVLVSDQVGEAARAALGITPTTRIFGLRDQHRVNLAVHRERNSFGVLQQLSTILPPPNRGI